MTSQAFKYQPVAIVGECLSGRESTRHTSSSRQMQYTMRETKKRLAFGARQSSKIRLHDNTTRGSSCRLIIPALSITAMASYSLLSCHTIQ